MRTAWRGCAGSWMACPWPSSWPPRACRCCPWSRSPGCWARMIAFACSPAAAAPRGPEQLAWLDRLEIDHDNLRRALDWAIESKSADGLCLASALHRFWLVRGYSAEALGWFNRLLASTPPQPTAAWAMGLARAAFF